MLKPYYSAALFNFILLFFTLSSCARLPSHTVALADVLLTEGERMHAMQVQLVQTLFAQKRKEIDTFITTKYTPTFVQEFTKSLPPDFNYKQEMPTLLAKMQPVVQDRRDEMQRTLENSRIAILQKIDADYMLYCQAGFELKNALTSVIKHQNATRQLTAYTTKLAQSSLDLATLEALINDFISETGNYSDKAKKIESYIQSISLPIK